MAGQRKRVVFEDFNQGVIEPFGGDSTQITKKSFRSAKNIRLLETAGVVGRRGTVSRAAGLPNNNVSVFEFRSNAIHALVASDGATIWVLESDVWTSKGTFPTAGTRASAAMLNQRMYLANGIDRLRVMEFTGGTWNIRAAGVDPPTNVLTVTATGGTGSAFNDYRVSYSFVDDRGFESNIGPASTVSARANDTINISNIEVGGANISFVNIYSSISNQRETFFVKQIANGTVATTIDAINLSRDEAIPEKINNTIPPDGIFSLFSHKARLYAMRYETFDTFYLFTPIKEPEYWPLANRQDLSSQDDPSVAKNFTTSSQGLMLYKETSKLLLQFDPESEGSPQVIMQGAGLVHDDGLTTLNGVAMSLTQRGFVAHDGVRPFELWKRIQATSDAAVRADNVLASFKDVRVFFFFEDTNTSNVITSPAFDLDEKRWLIDEWQLVSGQSTNTDTSLDFNEDADVDTFENVENGAQTIATGGGTTVITLSGTNSASLVEGVKIKFVGFATIYKVTDVTGANITLDGTAPPDTTDVEYIRGLEVFGGILRMT